MAQQIKVNRKKCKLATDQMEYLSCVFKWPRAKSTKENIYSNVNLTLNLYSAGTDQKNKEFMGFLSTA